MSKVVRCKMDCTHAETLSEDNHMATFMAVSDGSKENEDFFSSTASGSMSLSVVTEQHFEAGKSYYIDIQLAE